MYNLDILLLLSLLIFAKTYIGNSNQRFYDQPYVSNKKRKLSSISIQYFLFFMIIIVSFVSFYFGFFLIFFYLNQYPGIKHYLLNDNLIIPLVILTCLSFVGAMLVSNFFKEKILKAINSIIVIFKELNSLDDLTCNNLSKHDLFFKEYNQILPDISKFLVCVKQKAVDRNILANLIRLFDKYVITYENIKDPELIIKKFILECQQFVKVDGFFFIYDNDEQNFDLFLSSEFEFKKNEISENLKKYLKLLFLKNESRQSFDNLVIQLCDDTFFSIYFKKVFNIPVLNNCVGGVIIRNNSRDLNESFILEYILGFFINLQSTIKILSMNIRIIEHFSVRDALTNLFNQRAFWNELDFRINLAQKYKKKVAVLLIDVDNFKKINDKYGHYVGDRILEQLGKILNSFFSGSHFISRYGGDEFAGILFDVDLNEAINSANSLKNLIYNHNFIVNKDLVLKGLTTTVGIAIFPDNAQSSTDLFVFADNMVIKGKRGYKNSIILPEKNELVTLFKYEAELSLKVMEALKNKKIKFNLQPIYKLTDNNILGYEVLSRLEIDEMVIKADKFIPIITQLGLSTEFDFVVVEKVFEYLKNNNFDKCMFINVTPSTLSSFDFINMLEKVSIKCNINTQRVIFEIVERDTVENFDKLIENCKKIEKMGYKFAIDDFGSGYSSFMYLKALPANFVKVEGVFVKSMKNNLKDRLIVEAITNICRMHNISVIAEYVEDEMILKEAINLGIELGQGFYLGKPEEITMYNL